MALENLQYEGLELPVLSHRYEHEGEKIGRGGGTKQIYKPRDTQAKGLQYAVSRRAA